MGPGGVEGLVKECLDLTRENIDWLKRVSSF